MDFMYQILHSEQVKRMSFNWFFFLMKRHKYLLKNYPKILIFSKYRSIISRTFTFYKYELILYLIHIPFCKNIQFFNFFLIRKLIWRAYKSVPIMTKYLWMHSLSDQTHILKINEVIGMIGKGILCMYPPVAAIIWQPSTDRHTFVSPSGSR